MVRYVKNRDLASDLEAVTGIESDFEDDAQGVKDEGLKEGESRAVLTFGSFSAYVHFQPGFCLKGDDEFTSWRSLFFYLCTDSILFAPLKSQGLESRLNYIRENTVEVAPPPCSPKSVYALSNLVSLPRKFHA